MLGIEVPWLIYVPCVELRCATPLAYRDCSVKDQGSCTLFEVVGVMARLPRFPTTLGGPTWLTSGPGPHLQ
jgi:hypothetical protein